MKAAASILTPFLLAFLLAESIRPLPDWLMRKKLPLGISMLLTLLIVLVGGVAVVSLLGVSIAQLIERRPTYQSGVTSLQERMFAFLAARGINPSKLRFLDMFGPSRIVDLTGQMVGAVGQILSNTFLLIFLVVLLLFEIIEKEAKPASSKDPIGKVLARFQEASKDIRKYVAINGGVGRGYR